MTPILVDTDLIIDFTKGKNAVLQKLLKKQRQKEVELFVTPIVVAEFFTDIQLKDPEKRRKARRLFTAFSQTKITGETGYLAGKLLRERKTHTIGDALNASVCLLQNLELATRNIKDYEKIPKLILFTSTAD